VKLIQYIVLIFMLGSCTGAKYLSENQKFYKGAILKLAQDDKSKANNTLLKELSAVVEPEPNETLFGMRPAVWIYGTTKEPKGKGFRYFLKNNLGKPPVIYDPTIPEKTIRLLENRLFNNGYFKSKVICEVKEKQKEVSLEYEVSLKQPFTINEIQLPQDTSSIAQEIREINPQSLLKKGEVYNLELLKSERVRINEYLKDQGYYYFNPDFILFEADTALNNNELNLTIQLKDAALKSSLIKYRIDKVNVYPNYKIEQDSLIKAAKKTTINDISYRDPKSKFRYQIFEPLMFLKPGDIYQISNHNLTLKRLSELNAHKFMNIRFQKSDSISGILDTQIFLTPETTRSLLLDIEVTSKSNNFVGPEMSINFKNQNKWRGAEVFAVKLSGGFESQISGSGNTLNSYEVGINANVTIPRLIAPIRITTLPTSEIPKTKIELGNALLRRAGFYSFNKTKMSLGYTWHTNKNRFHQFNPININYFFLTNTTPEFDLLLDENPSLKQSFEDQFIIGGTYSYTVSDQLKKKDQNYLYFKSSFDLSGNLAQVLTKTVGNKNDQRNEILGLPYAQYVRTDFDFRYFWNLKNDRLIATRMLLGLGLAHGNSDELPYTKQFFIGGSNSIRAFRPRGIGPGSYQSPNDNSLFIDQSGDLKIEANLEYRARIYGVFKGAVFLDAGNVWLLNDDPNRPGGVFKSENIYNEIGVGTGAGLRLDFTYFVLRFDWAFPLKKPFILGSNGWVANKIDFASKEWRQNNLVLNVAIGYSF
jgi:outer membrane protein insertion porin family